MSLHARLAATIGRLALDVTLEVGAGTTLVVVGPNGSGKTSLLLLLLGALAATRARVTLDGTILADSDRRLAVPIELRRIGYLPQDYALFPHMSARDNIAFALASAPTRTTRAQRHARARAILADLGLEHLAARRADRLSGGEQQRVALARALAVSPRALLLDEPLAALDVHTRRGVRALLRDTLGALAIPTIIVTHDAADARALGARIAVLEHGTIAQRGTWDELAARPATPFVRELVGASG